MSNEKITVDAAALFKILTALNGSPHLIRELQVTRSTLFPDNPIDILIKEYNDWATSTEDKKE